MFDLFDMRYKQGVDLINPPNSMPPCSQRYINRQIPFDDAADTVLTRDLGFDLNDFNWRQRLPVPPDAPRTLDMAKLPAAAAARLAEYGGTGGPIVIEREWLPWIVTGLILLFLFDKLLFILLARR